MPSTRKYRCDEAADDQVVDLQKYKTWRQWHCLYGKTVLIYNIANKENILTVWSFKCMCMNPMQKIVMIIITNNNLAILYNIYDGHFR